jgi:hypothetical protein
MNELIIDTYLFYKQLDLDSAIKTISISIGRVNQAQRSVSIR